MTKLTKAKKKEISEMVTKIVKGATRKMSKPKLDKAQNKRFDEFVEEYHTTTQVEPRLLPEDKVKQHLAEELAIQKKEIIEKLEKMKKIRKPTHGTCCTCQVCGFCYEPPSECECERNEILDQVIKSIKEKGR